MVCTSNHPSRNIVNLPKFLSSRNIFSLQIYNLFIKRNFIYLSFFRRLFIQNFIYLTILNYNLILKWPPIHILSKCIKLLNILIVVHIQHFQRNLITGIIHMEMNNIQSFIIDHLRPDVHLRT